jgi:hypothetical protein
MMSTGYEHMTDQEFWAEVAHLLALVPVGGLADYVHAEAERRDAQLAANRQARHALHEVATGRAIARAQAAGTWADPMDAELNAGEKAESWRLLDAYNERLTLLAGQARTVLVGDTYETPVDAAQYAANEDEALKMLGADDEAEMRAVERAYERAEDA